MAQTLRCNRTEECIMPNMTTVDRSQLNLVNPSAAAIDIGSTMHIAAVNPDSTDTPIRAFGTFTHDLHDLARWFKLSDISTHGTV